MSNDTISLTSTSTPSAPSRTSGRSIVGAGVLASIAAAAVTTAIAAISTQAGVSFADRSGSAIPVSGFTTMTLLFSQIGVGLALVLQRRASRPRRLFVRVTATLLVLSFVPDLISGFAAGATVLLILAHLAAAAVVVPTLATRLSPIR